MDAQQDREPDRRPERQPERKPSVLERLTPAAAHANGNSLPPGFEEPAARPTAKYAPGPFISLKPASYLAISWPYG